MAYRLRRAETVADGVRRVIREEVECAASNLREPADPVTAVHEARKSVKKVRALLRLVSPRLREPFGAANLMLRDASRRISGLRDADVMIETLASVGQRFPEASYDELRQKLVAHRRRAPGRAAKIVASEMERAVDALAGCLIGEEFGALPGLEATYRKGRAALAEAEKNPTIESLHELRKRVKDHWYHIRLIKPLWNDILETREKNLKAIETWLGDDHNLAVLLETHPHEGLKPSVDELRKELENSALELARSLYVEKPRVFVNHIEELWDAWKAKPIEQAQMAVTRKKRSAA